MKKFKKIGAVLTLVLCMITSTATIYATESEDKMFEKDGTYAGRPWVVVESYFVPEGGVIPGEEFNLTLNLRNKSAKRTAGSVMVTCTTKNNEIHGAYSKDNTGYLETLYADEIKTISIPLQTAENITTDTIQMYVDIQYGDVANYDNKSQLVLTIPVAKQGILNIQNYSVPDTAYLNTQFRVNATVENTGIDDLSSVTMSIDGEGIEEKKESQIINLSGGAKTYSEMYIKFVEPGEQNIKVSFSYYDKNGELKKVSEQSFKVTVADDKESQMQTTNQVNNIIVMVGKIIILVLILLSVYTLWNYSKREKEEK